MMSDRHFQGNGIRLRAPEPEDLEVMFRFENATDVWEMSNTTGPYSRFQLKQYIEQTQNDLFADRQLRLMIENGNRQVVGMVDVCSFDPLHNRAEVGIMVDKSCRRQGITFPMALNSGYSIKFTSRFICSITFCNFTFCNIIQSSDRKSTRLNSSHSRKSRMPSSA